MIVISGILKVAPEDRKRVLEIVTPVVAASLAEDGCDAYGFWEDPGNEGTFRVFEEWASEDALNTHFGTPHLAELMTGMGTLKIEAMDLQRYEVTEKMPLF